MLGWKDLLITLPILGTALAVTYDVGYFYALDINMFTVFTAAEHITFAMEVLPLALLASSLTFIVPMVFEFGVARGKAEALQQISTGKKRRFLQKR
jgi:hypothetical protein